MKDKTKAHLAGLIDADGNVEVCRHEEKTRNVGNLSYGVSFSVDNTYRPLMKYLVKNFGGTFRVMRDNIDAVNKQPMYSWSPGSSKHAETVLNLVLPYLLIKRLRAKVCLEFLAITGTNPEARANIFLKYEEIKGSVTTNTLQNHYKPSLINAYFAGFFDGEGTIGVYKAKQSGYSRCSGYCYKPTIKSCNEFAFVIKYMQDLYGGGMFCHTRKNDPTRKPSNIWNLATNPTIESFLLKMMPYLVVKRDQANVMLNFVRLGKEPNPALRSKLADKLRELKWFKIESNLVGDHESVPMMT